MAEAIEHEEHCLLPYLSRTLLEDQCTVLFHPCPLWTISVLEEFCRREKIKLLLLFSEGLYSMQLLFVFSRKLSRHYTIGRLLLCPAVMMGNGESGGKNEGEGDFVLH